MADLNRTSSSNYNSQTSLSYKDELAIAAQHPRVPSQTDSNSNDNTKINSDATEDHSEKQQGGEKAPSAEPSSSRNVPRDMLEARPPNFKQKVQHFFYERGLADRPDYLNDIYFNTPRYVYVNQPLPEFMTNPSTGQPIVNYTRNKIRTTKYTPLSFLPKNILFQFRNIANAYFLMLIILGAFQIFGVASPGMAAVPLIVIVCITAAKDAFEDYRRGTSDSELNNSPIHLLSGLENPNMVVDYVLPWRKFKKASSRVTAKALHGTKRFFIMVFGSKKTKGDLARREHWDEENNLRRVSTIVSDYSYDSAQGDVTQQRKSTSSNRKSTSTNYRKSTQLARQQLSIPLPNSVLNPRVRAENAENRVTNFKNRRWKDINVGDLIRVRANEEIPADIILLSCSDPEDNCYIETKNLDGETNLKTKTTLQAGGSHNLKHSRDLGNTKFWVECDAPNKMLYNFKGTVHYENYNARGELINADEKESVNNENVLLRGCTLRNTKWAIGVVVYTGDETKVMLNSGITPTKVSRISRELNLSVIINFVLVFVMCLVSALINGNFYTKPDNSRIFFEFKAYGKTPGINGLIAFFVALIIYQSLIPVSLYISIEIIKTAQAFFIFSDLKMYYEKLDFPCVPKTWNISDDLGQIEYIFSDKTGTLTQNVMEFKKCTINGKSYGLAYTEAKQGLDKREGLDVLKESEKWKTLIDTDRDEMLNNLSEYSNNDQLHRETVTFVSNDYVKDTLVPGFDQAQKTANEQFMLALALCHTVVTEENEDGSDLRTFKAESPDEAALVAVARDVGIVFKGRSRKTLSMGIYGKEVEYELLETIAFTSARKRMTCVFRAPDGRILLISKGADNVIFQRLAQNNELDVLNKTALHLEEYAKEGLRTLCIAQKEVEPLYFNHWQQRYKEAYSSIDDSREEIIERLDEELESGLTLLGGTAIEDRLQQGVPDSIALLSQAGIKLWVLTGDRIETAINIGFSCNLLGNDMKLLVVRPDEKNMDDVGYIDELISKHLSENFGVSANSPEEIAVLLKQAKEDHSTPQGNFALIIDGAALTCVFLDSEDGRYDLLRTKFLLLGKQCKSVICCRVSPSQKAQVVKVVKDSLKVMTLAIGDGANDVAMIQASNVGIGIAGEEGRQAVMSSDYAIGQFRFLTRLLLVHGRWSYKRLAEMVPCFFYKNVVFTFTLFWFGIYNNFDGSYLYEYTYLIFFNLAFTSLPVIFLGVLDQDVSDLVSLIVPQLYRSGIVGLEWSQFKFVWYMCDGLYQLVVLFFFPYLLLYKAFANPQGLAIDHRFWFGVVTVCISVLSCNIYVLLQQFRWDWLTLLIDAISVLLVFFWSGAWSARVFAGEFYKAGAQTMGTLAVWCCLCIGTVVCVLPRFTYDFLTRNFRPRDIDIIREKARKGEYDDYPIAYDPTDLEDIERHRILKRLNAGDSELLHEVEHQVEGLEPVVEPSENHDGALSRTFKTIRRRATTVSRKNTVNDQAKHNRDLLSRPLNLHELRVKMIQDGELGHRNSLDRINTTHELPGLTQAETLISYHTRNSVQLDRV